MPAGDRTGSDGDAPLVREPRPPRWSTPCTWTDIPANATRLVSVRRGLEEWALAAGFPHDDGHRHRAGRLRGHGQRRRARLPPPAGTIDLLATGCDDRGRRRRPRPRRLASAPRGSRATADAALLMIRSMSLRRDRARSRRDDSADALVAADGEPVRSDGLRSTSSAMSSRRRLNRASSSVAQLFGLESRRTEVRRVSIAVSRSRPGSSTRPSVTSTIDQVAGSTCTVLGGSACAETEHRAVDVQVVRPGLVDDQRRQVPRVDHPAARWTRVQQQDAQRGELAAVVAQQCSFEQRDELGGIVVLDRVGAQRVPQLHHDGGRVDGVPGDVADGDQQPTVVQLDDVVEVAADLGRLARRARSGRRSPGRGCAGSARAGSCAAASGRGCVPRRRGAARRRPASRPGRAG